MLTVDWILERIKGKKPEIPRTATDWPELERKAEAVIREYERAGRDFGHAADLSGGLAGVCTNFGDLLATWARGSRLRHARVQTHFFPGVYQGGNVVPH